MTKAVSLPIVAVVIERGSLEKEIRNSDLMLSIPSNSSLQSTWCLNAIDLAMGLKKVVVPIVIEQLDDSVKSRAFNLRFMNIQYYASCGNPRRSTNSFSDSTQPVSAVETSGRIPDYALPRGKKHNDPQETRMDELLRRR